MIIWDVSSIAGYHTNVSMVDKRTIIAVYCILVLIALCGFSSDKHMTSSVAEMEHLGGGKMKDAVIQWRMENVFFGAVFRFRLSVFLPFFFFILNLLSHPLFFLISFFSFSLVCPQQPHCKLSSSLPEAKINSQSMCRSIGGKSVTCSACTIQNPRWGTNGRINARFMSL